QAHKQYLRDRVFYYYGTGNTIQLEGTSGLVPRYYSWWLRLIGKLFKKSPNYLRDAKLTYSFKRNHIDAILVEYGTHAHNLLSFLKSMNSPVVVHYHGYDASMDGVVERCNHYREVFQMVNKVIVVSKVMEQALLTLGCPKEKLVYNVYGPQPEFETVRPNFKEKQFVAIGRFTNKKAPYYTILAFHQVVKKYPQARLLMGGDGILLNTCKNLVRYYKLENHVEFFGVITPEKYRNLLSESLAFVQHSITALDGDMEGTPLAILEASASGLPVIATKHAGIPDVVVHGDTGWLCDEHDVDAMANYMLWTLEHIEEAKQMGAKGKTLVQDQFNLKRHIDVLQNTLEKATKF
ncbi:MAG: glycosyltransferase, partial [Flavobacteriaceae bacterium]